MDGYPAVLKKERDGRITVEFPDFPEVHTYGDDEPEAMVRARDALATILDAYIRDRQAIPHPSMIAPGLRKVRLPALTKAKLELYTAMREARMSKTDLARRLGWHLPQVDRLLDVHHASRLDQLETAFSALGKDLVVYTTAYRNPSSAARRPAAYGARGRGSSAAGSRSNSSAGGGMFSPQPAKRVRAARKKSSPARKRR